MMPCSEQCNSGLQADVVVPHDASTHLNSKPINRLTQANRELVCGQALCQLHDVRPGGQLAGGQIEGPGAPPQWLLACG